MIPNRATHHNLQIRKKQRSQNVSEEDMRTKLHEWHTALRERLIKTRKEGNYDDKRGTFPPEFQFNIDQSTYSFVFDSNRTYHQFTDDRHNEKMCISQTGTGLDKRQCSLQICFSQGKQPSLGIAFPGAGKWVSDDERSACHKDVSMFFRENI